MDKPTPIFADGIVFTRPRENAPEWVKGAVSVNVAKFVEFLKAQRQAGNISAKGWLNLDLKESKDKGSLYFQVNTYKAPETKSVNEIKEKITKSLTSKGAEGEEILAESIPF